MRTSFLSGSRLLHLSIIAVTACLVYSNTFSVPFHYDDKLNIVDYAWIKDLSAFWPPAGNRWFGYFTFALNYHFNGLDPAGYHAVNLAIHVLNGFLIYGLIMTIFRTPYWSGTKNGIKEQVPGKHALAALFASLLFVAHPVQTQAVTYIVQRLASLAAFFYLLSLAAYARARLLASERGDGRKQWVSLSLYALSLLAAILGMKTKEIVFTLPFVIMLSEVFFFRSLSADAVTMRRRLLYLLPFLLTLALIPLTLNGFGGDLQDAFRATHEITRHDYLLTQFRVLMTYLRLLILPIDQSIDYDYRLYRAFGDPAVLLSFLGLVCLAGFAGILFMRSRREQHPSRLVSFGIFWFFVTISVESSLVPIADVIFEHRLYLPSVGAAIAVSGAALFLLGWVQERHGQAARIIVAAGILAVILLSVAAYNRNNAWISEITLWEDAVRKHPGSARALNMLGILYKTAGRRAEARNAFLRAVETRPSFAEAHVNLGRVYVEDGDPDAGMSEFMKALSLRSLDDIDTANLFINMGDYYMRKGMPDRAIEFYHYALPLVPGDATVHFFLGKAYQTKGMEGKAAEHFLRARQLNPDRY